MSWASSLVVLATIACASASSVSTSDGTTWVGKSSDSLDYFYGIPFAQPPVGALRFAPPVAPTTGFGTFDATEYGFACPQMNILDEPSPACSTSSERKSSISLR